jgi:hypothetical protein
MALTLNSSAGSASANAYCTLASANDFLQQNIHAYSAWSSLSTANAEACLIWATDLLDKQMEWHGNKATSTQSLRWPREDVSDADGYAVDNDSVPLFLWEATAEYARWLSLKDRTLEDPTKGFHRLEVSGLAAYINARDRVETMPVAVYEMVRSFGSKGLTSSVRVLVRR